MIKYKNIYLTGSIPVDKAYVWRNDPNIYKYCRQHTLLSLDEHLKYIKNINLASSRIKLFGIKSEDKKDIGVCALTSVNYINRNAEFSLYIATPFQGKGYAKNALISLLNLGFNDLNLHRIWGEVFEYNNKALNMFYALGFIREGELRDTYYKNGTFINSYIISILKEEFKIK